MLALTPPTDTTEPLSKFAPLIVSGKESPNNGAMLWDKPDMLGPSGLMVGVPAITVKPAEAVIEPEGVVTDISRGPSAAVPAIVIVTGSRVGVALVPTVIPTPLPLAVTLVAPARFTPLMNALNVVPAAPDGGEMATIPGAAGP